MNQISQILSSEARKMYETSVTRRKDRSPIRLRQEDKNFIRFKINELNFSGPTKAPGWDLLSQELLRDKTENMNLFLMNCVIECLELGYIPKNLATSRLIPFNKTPGKVPTVLETRNIATQPLII